MIKNKDYRCFTCNQILVTILWAFGTTISLLCVGFIIGAFPLWVILMMGGIALPLIIASIITTVLLRYKVTSDGITLVTLRRKKTFVSWNNLDSVKIKCRHGQMTVYIVELKSDNLSIKFNTYSEEVMNSIIKFSKDCDNFQRMFLERLKEAEKSY